MQNKRIKWLILGLLVLSGALMGFGYYAYMARAIGAHGLALSPLRSILYAAFTGWLAYYLLISSEKQQA